MLQARMKKKALVVVPRVSVRKSGRGGRLQGLGSFLAQKKKSLSSLSLSLSRVPMYPVSFHLSHLHFDLFMYSIIHLLHHLVLLPIFPLPHPLSIDPPLFTPSRYLLVGRDYPLGMTRFRELTKEGFRKHAHLSEEEEIIKQVARGRWYLNNELIAVIKFKKYRAMRARYVVPEEERDAPPL